MGSLSVYRLAALVLAFYSSTWPAAGIEGRILNSVTGKPVRGAEVTLLPEGKNTQSDSSGFFQFDSLSPGDYSVNVEHGEYFPQIRRGVILLSGNKSEFLEFEILTRAYILNTMEVQASSDGKIADMPNSGRVMNAEEIRRAPGALMDVQRVVQTFPGVQSRGDNVNEVLVRGGFPGENLFLMDNIEIPNPNYFANPGSGGGVISIVNPLLVKKLTFTSGAPPARYGGKLSSVLDIDVRDGNQKLLFGGADLGFAGAGLHSEGPLFGDNSFLASFRKSYLNILAQFEPSIAIPDFFGGQAKWTNPMASGKLSGNALGGRSSIRIENADEDFGLEGNIIEANGDVYALGGTVSQYLGEKWEYSTTLFTTGSLIGRRQFRDTDLRSKRESTEWDRGVKGSVSYFQTANTIWETGGEFHWMDFQDKNQSQSDTLKQYASALDSVGTPWLDSNGALRLKWNPPDADLETQRWAAYASVRFPLYLDLALTLGARVEGLVLSNDLSLLPRIGLRWPLPAGLEFTASGGLQSQMQNFTAYAAQPSNAGLASKRSGIVSGGVEKKFKNLGSQIGVNLYYKGYEGLLMDSLDGEPGSRFLFQSSAGKLKNGEAKSKGVEIFMERKLNKNWFYNTAYAYSVSKTSFEGINGGAWQASDFDYPHLFNFSGGLVWEPLKWDWYGGIRKKIWFQAFSWLIPLGDRMEFSARIRYASGRPLTPVRYDTLFRRWVSDPAEWNQERYPDYSTLDLRLERRIGYGWLQMMFYFDFQNVLNRKNVFTYIYSDATGKRVTVYQLPFFPVGGFIIGF